MSEALAYVNGQFVPESQASVSIYDRGFTNGVGVFERTRTFRGVPFRLAAHLGRLSLSLRMTHLSAGMSMDEMERLTLELIDRNRDLLGPNDDFTIGHFVSLGTTAPTVVIFTQRIPFRNFAHQYTTGAHVVTPPSRQVPTSVMDPKIKTTSRMSLYLAAWEAKLVDPDAYPLILDANGNVCELNTANFWIVRAGEIVTPPSRSILRGITRDALFECAASLGIPVREADFQVYDVMAADEAFLSSTSPSVLPVTRVNGCQIGDGTPGPVVRRVQDGWSQMIGLDFVAQALSHVRDEAVPNG